MKSFKVKNCAISFLLKNERIVVNSVFLKLCENDKGNLHVITYSIAAKPCSYVGWLFTLNSGVFLRISGFSLQQIKKPRFHLL